MNGRILAANHHGAYVIRFEGDVRLTLCTTIDDYIKKMFKDPEFVSVWVDLCSAEGVDSTTLGLLAKLALQARNKFGFTPAIYSCNPGINRLLKSMGFQRIFKIHEEICQEPEKVDEVPMKADSEAAFKNKVVEAHRVLMDLNPENRERFTDLMSALEHN